MKYVATRNTHCGSFALKKGEEVPAWVVEQKPEHFEDLVKAGFVEAVSGHVSAAFETEAELQVEAKPTKRGKKA